MTTTRTDIFGTFTDRDDWGGFGYLGERARQTNPEQIVIVDAEILERTDDWTEDELFAWANSKDGRLFADLVFLNRGS